MEANSRGNKLFESTVTTLQKLKVMKQNNQEIEVQKNQLNKHPLTSKKVNVKNIWDKYLKRENRLVYQLLKS